MKDLYYYLYKNNFSTISYKMKKKIISLGIVSKALNATRSESPICEHCYRGGYQCHILLMFFVKFGPKNWHLTRELSLHDNPRRTPHYAAPLSAGEPRVCDTPGTPPDSLSHAHQARTLHIARAQLRKARIVVMISIIEKIYIKSQSHYM